MQQRRQGLPASFPKAIPLPIGGPILPDLDAEHFIPFIEDLDEPIGVKNQAVAGGQVNFVRAFRRSRIGETTEDAALRIESTEAAIRDQHCWRVPCGGKRYTTTAPDKTTCCHREVKAVRCYAIVYELVKASQ